MMVRVGSARHDENGTVKGGAAGDQTGHEVETQGWYKHSKGWVVIRAKDAAAREKIARDMEYACANSNIGYDQSQNTTLFTVAKKVGFDCSKVTTKCETDCSRLVRVCLWYAGIEAPPFYTGTQVEVLNKTGRFEVLTSPKYTESPDYLLRGDILVTKVKGHTVVVLDNGEKVPVESGKTYSILRQGTSGQRVRELQELLNYFGYRDAAGASLKVDGKFGEKTAAALAAMQKDQKLTVEPVCRVDAWKRFEEMKKAVRRVRLLSNSYLRSKPVTGAKRIKILKKGTTYTATRGKAWVYLSEPAGWVPGKKLEDLE